MRARMNSEGLKFMKTFLWKAGQ